MRFYLGTHQPSWLARDLGVPMLVSHRRLAGRRTLPRATSAWALDSGGFTELSLHGRWRTDPTAYVAAVRRYAEEIGNLDWAAPQDWMTEDTVRARTGLSVRAHQRRTVTNYLRLRELAPDLPIIPVLQGQSITDYHRCADLYEHHGIDLADLPLVGVGSVCRRQHTLEVERVVRSLAGRGYRLHTFGAKILGLARYADAIVSSDSAAWSLHGRHTPGCSPSHRSESNCLRFALAWHTRLLANLATPPAAVNPHRQQPVRGRRAAAPRPRPPQPKHRNPRDNPRDPTTRTRHARPRTTRSPARTAPAHPGPSS